MGGPNVLFQRSRTERLVDRYLSATPQGMRRITNLPMASFTDSLSNFDIVPVGLADNHHKCWVYLLFLTSVPKRKYLLI